MTALAIEVEHGTRQSYAAGCKCKACKGAEAAYRADRRKSPRGYVAAGKVRTHIALLVDDGVSCREIARRSGVGYRTVSRIGRGDIVTCTPATRAAVLGVLPGWATNDISVVRDDGALDDEPAEPTFDDPLSSLRMMLADAETLAWKTEGECARLSISVEKRQLWFFPMRGESTAPAMTICARCPVWLDCLQFALDTNADGIWGRSAGNHRRKIVHHSITVAELADAGMADDPDLPISDAIERVVASRA